MKRSPERPAADHRTYPRVATQVSVRFCTLEVPSAIRDYLDGVVRNASLGGLFIETRHPSPVGAVIALDFAVEVGGGTEVVHARAIVRWRQTGSPPAGMGVEFIDVDGLRTRSFESWFRAIQQRGADDR